MTSTASKAKTEAGFGLSGPSYLLASVIEAEIGPIEAVLDQKVNVRLKKKTRHLPYKTAGSAAVKKEKKHSAGRGEKRTLRRDLSHLESDLGLDIWLICQIRANKAIPGLKIDQFFHLDQGRPLAKNGLPILPTFQPARSLALILETDVL